MKQPRIPDHCKGCQSLWTGGKKDGVHNRWCCAQGKTCYDGLGHCKLKNLKQLKVKNV